MSSKETGCWGFCNSPSRDPVVPSGLTEVRAQRIGPKRIRTEDVIQTRSGLPA